MMMMMMIMTMLLLLLLLVVACRPPPQLISSRPLIRSSFIVCGRSWSVMFACPLLLSSCYRRRTVSIYPLSPPFIAPSTVRFPRGDGGGIIFHDVSVPSLVGARRAALDAESSAPNETIA
jgi:hypothetical protein